MNVQTYIKYYCPRVTTTIDVLKKTFPFFSRLGIHSALNFTADMVCFNPDTKFGSDDISVDIKTLESMEQYLISAYG